MEEARKQLEEALKVCEKILRTPLARHIPALESTMAMVAVSLEKGENNEKRS